MTIFPNAKKAQVLADASNVSELEEPLDKRWLYKAEVFENGKAAVQVYDEDGNFVEYL